jgi:anti-sigma B factor antagonist
VLDVEITGARERRVLFLTGQLDLDSAPQLDRALEVVCADGVREVVLNLQRLDFIDTTGLATVLAGRTLCKQHGCRYFIDTPVPASLNRLLAVTGAHRVLPFKRRRGTAAPTT